MLRFVINLDRATDRWVYTQYSLTKNKIEAQRVSAIDGRKLSPEQLNSLVPDLEDISKILCPRAISPGEIGAFLSHKECWRRLVSSEHNWALIMEDDLCFSSKAVDFMSTTSWIPKGINLVQLFVFKEKWEAIVDKKSFMVSNDAVLYHPYKPNPIGSQAYFISKKAAQCALNLSEKLMSPVDEFLFNPISDFARAFPVYRLNPAVVRPLDDRLPSTIGVNPESYPRSIWIQNHPLRRLRKLQIRLLTTLKGKKVTFRFAG